MHEEYDAATALLAVDVQNDFADPAGGLAVAGAEAIMPVLNAEIAAARAAGSFVAYTQDWHRSRGIRRVVIGGLATDYCVKATVLDAIALGYETHVLVDAVRAVEVAPGDGERALAAMAAAGAMLVLRPIEAAATDRGT